MFAITIFICYNVFGGFMEMMEKLKILADSAKYDASCSSSGSSRKNTSDGVGNASECGICHSFASDGRCISLLKILFTNCCIYDCKYCINRKSNNVKRAMFTKEEVCELTINFYKRNYIEGLFLSSGIVKSPDYTMNMLIETIYLLRNKYHFNGYIHAKCIPGASDYLIKRLGSLVDRLSTNIELPSSNSLKLLAPDKNGDKVAHSMKYIRLANENNRNIAPAGQSTQMIIGATPDSDLQIMRLSKSMYDVFKLKRVFYSAYVPLNKDNLLPDIKMPPLTREHRLYQADWLLRYYKFDVDELLSKNNPNFNVLLDPKCNWALNHLELFPTEINKASFDELIRVPGIGIESAKKIIKLRKNFKIYYSDLKKMGISIKRAKYFITCNGEYFMNMNLFKKNFIKENLILEEKNLIANNKMQLSLFN